MEEVASSDCVFQVGMKSDLLLEWPTVPSYLMSESSQWFSDSCRPRVHRLQDAVKCQTVLNGFFFSISLGVENYQMKMCSSALLPELVSFSKVKDVLIKIGGK